MVVEFPHLDQVVFEGITCKTTSNCYQGHVHPAETLAKLVFYKEITFARLL